ncbi:MAG: PD-(D/E)XK nuclease family protein, partial [Cyanobacteria bacterium P01_C01_bin.73]
VADSVGLLSLSQGHLNVLSQCDRRFQYLFLEGLIVPPSPDQQASLDWGSRFHLVMQQRQMGLPTEQITAQDAELQASLEQLLIAAPEVLSPPKGEGTLHQSEHRRTLSFNNYLLTAIYDLVHLTPNRGEIFDWKTYLVPRKRAYLERDWQSRLYLFLLAETTDLPPEALSITYWFVRSRDPQTQALHPQKETIQYSRLRHQQTRQDLTTISDRLTRQIAALQTQAAMFPKVDLAKGYCDTCPFAVRCQRISPADSEMSLPALSHIDEVAL